MMMYGFRSLFLLKIPFLLGLCLLVISIPTQAHPLVRDEAVIFELLTSGEIDLSEDVAKAFGQDQSLTKIRRIGLVMGDSRIRAAFRDKTTSSITEEKVTFNDTYYHELAAYVISRYLGLNIVPPTVMRSIPIAEEGLKPSDELRRGTLQFWIENSIIYFNFMDTDLVYPGLDENKKKQIKEIKAFDCIIGNVDRHAGNVLVDMNERFQISNEVEGEPNAYLGKLWAIDHSRAFYRGSIGRAAEHCKLSIFKAGDISLQFAQGMSTWNIDEVESLLLASGLTGRQIKSIRLKSIERRFQRVKKHFEELQQKSGLSDEEFFSSGIWHRVR